MDSAAVAMLRGPSVMVDSTRNSVYEARRLLGVQAPEPGCGVGRGKLDYRLYVCMRQLEYVLSNVDITQ